MVPGGKCESSVLKHDFGTMQSTWRVGFGIYQVLF